MHKQNNAKIDNAKNTDIVMPIYNFIDYSDNYSKTSESLLLYYRDEQGLNDVGALDNFPGNEVSLNLIKQ